MPELELIGAAPSNYVWTCRIALAEKGVRYRHNEARPHTADVDAIHPFGKIPVMRHGEVELCESRAICAYIDNVFDGPKLAPADPAKAAQVEQWVSIVNTHIDPLWVRQYLRAHFFPNTPDGSPASCNNSPRRTADRGTFSDGFNTKVLPATTASGNIHSGIITGKLKGGIPAQTPSGYRYRSWSTPPETSRKVRPWSSVGAPHAKSTTSIPRLTSPRDSSSVLP